MCSSDLFTFPEDDDSGNDALCLFGTTIDAPVIYAVEFDIRGESESGENLVCLINKGDWENTFGGAGSGVRNKWLHNSQDFIGRPVRRIRSYELLEDGVYKFEQEFNTSNQVVRAQLVPELHRAAEPAMAAEEVAAILGEPIGPQEWMPPMPAWEQALMFAPEAAGGWVQPPVIRFPQVSPLNEQGVLAAAQFAHWQKPADVRTEVWQQAQRTFNGFTLDLKNLGLTDDELLALVRGLPPLVKNTVSSLVVQENNLQHLPRALVEELPELYFLNIRGNPINYVADALRGLRIQGN